jgi:hypothetical protein
MKRMSSLYHAPELLAEVFDLPDYKEPPDTYGISVFWVQEGNFKNSRLMDLLDWLDDRDLPTVGLKEPKEDPLLAAKARLEIELALIQAELDKKRSEIAARLEAELALTQAELDKKRSEIAALTVVQQAELEFVVGERKSAVSRRELELAEATARSLVPY